METARAGKAAFWTCAGFTLLSALVSMTFSLLALHVRGNGHQHEYALYAASRSVALPLAIVSAMALRSRAGLASLAVAMILVQMFDAYVGFAIHNAGELYGPLLIAVINAGLLWFMMLRANR